MSKKFNVDISNIHFIENYSDDNEINIENDYFLLNLLHKCLVIGESFIENYFKTRIINIAKSDDILTDFTIQLKMLSNLYLPEYIIEEISNMINNK